MKLWLSNHSGEEKLWISGPAGCGKGFLAERIITELELQEEKTSTQHGVVHCCLSGSDPARGNLQAILRATLHQALHLVPELVARFLSPTFEEAQSRDHEEQEIWTTKVLTTIWVDAMAQVGARQPLTFVIDGLDEISTECRETFFDCLGELPQKVREAYGRLKRGTGTPHPPKMKFLALSRCSERISRRLVGLGFKSYDVQPEDTKEDIKKTVCARLSSIWNGRGRDCNAELEEIRNKIADNANGSYLWAILVVELLRRARMTSKGQPDIQSLLKQYVACDINELYTHIFLGLNKNPTNAAFVKQVLQWAIFQQEGLKLSEFKIADALATATAQHPGQTISPEILTACLDHNIRLRVELHCGHLVKFQDDGRLSLTHRALKDHLTTQTTRSPLSSSNPARSNPNAEFYLNSEEAHASLANLCIAYLTMPCFGTSAQPALPLPEFLPRSPPTNQLHNEPGNHPTNQPTPRHPHPP